MNTVDYLRISLIDRCNFQCLYCMPEGEKLDYILKQDLLTDDELLLLLRDVLIPSGFTRFRLTGGEPLLRPNIVQLVQQFSQLPHLQDLSLSTNAFLLADLARPLYEAGLQRVNISLDSLDPQIFGKIIGDASSHLANSRSQTRWIQVWRGIQAAHEVGFDPLKLNVVVIPGVNDHEVLELAALTLDRCWHVRFIEFMPIGNGSLFGDRGWLPSEEIRQQIRDRWGLQEGQVVGNGPADIFQIPGAKGTLGFISQMSECFCDRCNRMRLSADGWLRPCLLNEEGQLDLKTELRRGVSTAELRHRVQLLLQQKPEINYKQRESGTITGAYSRTMSQIGG